MNSVFHMRSERRSVLALLILLGILLLSGCAATQPAFDTPRVSVSALRLLPSDDMAPRFEIDLHLINPNPVPLALKGIYYKVRLEGHEVLNGVNSSLPTIEAYGEVDIRIEAATDLISGLQLVTDLLSRPRDSITYEFEAKLDPGSLLPSIRIKDLGQINLQQGR